MRLGLALLVIFLAAASPAAADSIVFVRAGNVWITHARRQHQSGR